MSSFRDFLQESIRDQGILKACFLAGTPGAGKSYVSSKILGAIQPRIVNTDKAYEFLGHQLGVKLSKELPQELRKTLVDKSKHLTIRQLQQYLNSMLPLIIDGTSNSIPNLLHRTGILESLGYDVGMIYIETSLEKALARAAERDRHVDEDFIRNVNEKLKEAKHYYHQKFDFFQVIQNDGDELDDEVIRKAFVKATTFFKSPPRNPIGKQVIEELDATKKKYLTDSESIDVKRLNAMIGTWYGR